MPVVLIRIHLLVPVQRIDPRDLYSTEIHSLHPVELVFDIRFFDLGGKPPPAGTGLGSGVEGKGFLLISPDKRLTADDRKDQAYGNKETSEN